MTKANSSISLIFSIFFFIISSLMFGVSATAQETSSPHFQPDRTGVQFRIIIGPEFNDAFVTYLDWNGAGSDTLNTQFAGINTGFELGYAWEFWGLFIHTEFSSHWKTGFYDEIDTTNQWTSAEIDAFFRMFRNTKWNMHPFIGIGLGAYLSEDIRNDKMIRWDTRSFVVIAECGVEWDFTPHFSLGFRLAIELTGIFTGTIGLRPSLIMTYTL